MAHITTCPKCGKLYEDTCEELANAPDRQCDACFDQMIDEADQDESDADYENRYLDSQNARENNRIIR